MAWRGKKELAGGLSGNEGKLRRISDVLKWKLS
jgi:hypothetical protein